MKRFIVWTEETEKTTYKYVVNAESAAEAERMVSFGLAGEPSSTDSETLDKVITLVEDVT